MAYPVSDDYLSAISQSHQATGLVQVCRPAGDVLATIPVRSGVVEADADRSILRTCNIELLDDSGSGSFVPRAAGDMLHPWTGNELRLYRSVTLPDGAVESIPLGVYRIGPPTVDQTADGVVVRLTGADRASRVAANAWSYVVSAYAKTVPETLRDALADRFPALPASIAESTAPAPTMWWFPGFKDDPWRNLRDFAASVGWSLTVDRAGVAVATPATASPATPVREWVEGASCTVVSVQRELPGADGPNGVVAIGGDIRQSFRAEAWVEDPAHPLWRGGLYGEVAELLPGEWPDQAAAQEAVEARLAEILAGVVGVTVTAVPDAALDPGDVVRLDAPTSGVSGLYRVRRVTCPAGAEGVMSVDLRAVF